MPSPAIEHDTGNLSHIDTSFPLLPDFSDFSSDDDRNLRWNGEVSPYIVEMEIREHMGKWSGMAYIQSRAAVVIERVELLPEFDRASDVYEHLSLHVSKAISLLCESGAPGAWSLIGGGRV